MPLTPDTKNWTWVLDRPCPECGFDAAATDFSDVPGLLRDSAEDWRHILAGPAAAAAFAAVEPSQLERRGLRSNGSAFTVDSLARYFLHDALHHVWDVRPRSAEA
ncbi:hypothetical protein OL239_19080 [Arthrobacter sp. ATA002]|uniref:hypothetical protein n=1 Tax=Arthrobacter sp. ATA002 TaxID=2991715 RepID=UPI0022A66409|nr:hypothetical protein [Arthrobacter sp. ATA002]WAP51799.1 hypothetical protein OL239_19080 [Arthrobacter sp. ATA002]